MAEGQYPREVQKRIDVLKWYREDQNLKAFNVLHMYPGEIAYPDGFYDSRWFELVGYNTRSLPFRRLGKHDGVNIEGHVFLSGASIFADGSTTLQFQEFVSVSDTQSVYVTRAE